jgi:hypothetical protein
VVTRESSDLDVDFLIRGNTNDCDVSSFGCPRLAFLLVVKLTELARVFSFAAPLYGVDWYGFEE